MLFDLFFTYSYVLVQFALGFDVVYCHTPKPTHPGRGQHSETIDVPQANPWLGLLNSAADSTQLNQ